MSDVARRHGGSDQMIHTWCKKYAEAADIRRHRQLEKENARPMRLLAELDLEIDVMKDLGRGKF